MEDITPDLQQLLDSIPDLDEYKKLLDDLLELNLEGLTYEEIKVIYGKHVRFIPQTVMVVSKEDFNSTLFYRVRKHTIAPIKESMITKRAYSYPFPQYCKENGRLNIKNKPVFYCSDYAFPAMLECKLGKEERGFLGIWKPNVNTPVHIACFLSKMIQRNNAMYKTIENFRKSVDESTNAGRHKKPQLELLNNFLFDQFVYEKPPYSITSYISHEILFNNMVKEVTVEGIIYPSIESSLRYCNYAFHPFFSDRFMELQKVIEFTLNIDKELFKGDYTMGRIGVPVNGTIVWKMPSKKEAKDFYDLIHQGFIK